MKFTKAHKIAQNSVEILSNTCLCDIFETYLSKIYLETLSLKRGKRPETTRHTSKLCCKKMGTSHDVKGFGIGLFLERVVVERANDDLCLKNVKNAGLISAKLIDF